ncbi:MAG: hypothetical protein GY929_13080, partial [Actinomycetia bacterium]|nr:hypothetical protein [Actinomycetes bacterium]
MALTLLLMLAVAFFAAGRVVDASMDDVERVSSVDALARVERAIGRDLDSIGKSNRDWAAWDDTYRFMADQNEAYLASNLPPVAIAQLDLHAMLWVDTAGDIVFGSAVDADTGEEISLPAGLAAAARSEAMHLESETSTIAGIVMLDDGPAMITSYPVLTSAGAGPTRGALIMVRFLDDAI